MQLKLKQSVMIAAILMVTQSVSFSYMSWLLPSTTILSSNNTCVTIDAARSNDLFYANHHAIGIDGIKVTDLEAQPLEIKNNKTGLIRRTLDAKVNKQGVYEVDARCNIVFASWKGGDKNKFWRGDLDELEKKDLRETDEVELSFIDKYPKDLVENEEARFSVLHRGQAAKNIEIEINLSNELYRNEKQPVIVKTDYQGRFGVTFKLAAPYLIKVYTKFNGCKIKGVDVIKKDAFNAVLEVMPE